ncbi:hypothetical protein [Priestia aryabhattai]
MSENNKLINKFSKDFFKKNRRAKHHLDVMETMESLKVPVRDAIILRINHCAVAIDFTDQYNFMDYTTEEYAMIQADVEAQEKLYQTKMDEVLQFLGVEDSEERIRHTELIKYSFASNPFEVLYELIEDIYLRNKNKKSN